eukprot:COSAG02_NODE_11545_length_1701_cov_10.353933_3_plen_52_part_01
MADQQQDAAELRAKLVARKKEMQQQRGAGGESPQRVAATAQLPREHGASPAS